MNAAFKDRSLVSSEHNYEKLVENICEEEHVLDEDCNMLITDNLQEQQLIGTSDTNDENREDEGNNFKH